MKPPSPYSVARQLNSIAEIDEYLKAKLVRSEIPLLTPSHLLQQASEGDLKATVLGYFDKTTNSEDIALFEEVRPQTLTSMRIH